MSIGCRRPVAPIRPSLGGLAQAVAQASAVLRSSQLWLTENSLEPALFMKVLRVVLVRREMRRKMIVAA
jgi:hypothetical protein